MTPAELAEIESHTCGDISCDQCNEERDKLVQAVRELQWQPIETAPKEGTFLVYLPEGELGDIHVMTMRRCKQFATIGHHFEYDTRSKPTHWMPLPQPPLTPNGKE